jgi:hypothetical protein
LFHFELFEFLTETKLQAEQFDLNVKNFVVHNKNRKNAKAASGGVAILVKSHLSMCVQVVQNNCEFAVWVRVKRLIDKDILLGAVYIPPEKKVSIQV